MRSIKKIEDVKLSLDCLKKTRELICFAMQLEDAVNKGVIRPDHFEKRILFFEPYSNNNFCIELDWERYPEIFQQTATDARVNIISHAVITCKESNSKALWVAEEQNPALYAAQMILKMVRDAFGHMRAESEQFVVARWDISEGNRKIFEIEKCGVRFDAQHLNGEEFKWSHLGGLANFMKIIDFLIEDLRRTHEKLLNENA